MAGAECDGEHARRVRSAVGGMWRPVGTRVALGERWEAVVRQHWMLPPRES